MDLMKMAEQIYARWCTAHKGKSADGAPLPCWDARSGEQKAVWTAIAESAYHHTMQHQLAAKPVSGAAIEAEAKQPAA